MLMCEFTKDDSERDTVTLEADEHGVLRPMNQVTDYRFRGEALADYNIIDFFVDTYEDRKKDENVETHQHISSNGGQRKRG